MLHGGGSARRWPPLPARSAFGVVARGLLACARGRRAFLGRRELHACTPCLGETDRDRLLRRSCAVLPLANVIHLFLHELPSLRARRFSFALVLPRALDRCSFRHLLLRRLTRPFHRPPVARRAKAVLRYGIVVD